MNYDKRIYYELVVDTRIINNCNMYYDLYYTRNV